MENNLVKIALLYDQMGREFFHKLSQLSTDTEADDAAEFGTGRKLKPKKAKKAKGKK